MEKVLLDKFGPVQVPSGAMLQQIVGAVGEMITRDTAPITPNERIYDLERRAATMEYVVYGFAFFLLLVILMRGMRS